MTEMQKAEAEFRRHYRERWRRICVICGEPFGMHTITEARFCAVARARSRGLTP
jgi:hypothetical protein